MTGLDDIVDTLREIDLTEYQSRAYVAAVSRGTARISELSDEAEIPQQRIYDVVDDLKKLGLVEVHEGSNGKEAVAVPPEVGLSELKQQRFERFESNVDDAIGGLSELFNEVDTSMGFVTVVNHESSIRRHVGDAIETAAWRLFLSIPLGWYRDFQTEIRAALDRGVSVRLLVQAESQTVVENTLYPDGLQVRYRPSADLVVAADREYGIFRGVAAESVTRPSLVTKDGSMVEMFQRYSEQFWTPSRAIRTEHQYPRRYLTPWGAITDHTELLDSGASLAVYIEGHDTETGQTGTWEGAIVDHELETRFDNGLSVVLPEVAQLVVETADDRVTVGGWDATLEDVAAHGLEIRQQ